MKQNIFAGSIVLLILAGCASTEWVEIKDVKKYSAMREELGKPNLAFDKVTIVRLKNKAERVEVTSIGPAVIGAARNGPPAAKTLFTFSQERDRIILFSQDVKNWKAFSKEIPVSQLIPGFVFHFPVVQESGEVVEQTYTVERVIVQ